VPPSTSRAPSASSGPTVSEGKRPTSTHSSASSSTGTRIQRGGSCGSRGSSRGAPLKNTSCTKRTE
jgi:hypothetical protein